MATNTAPSTTAQMPVQVSGRHMAVGDALRTRITDELIGGVGKYFERGGSADVTVIRDGHGFCVDVVVALATGQQLVARGQGGEAHAAFGGRRSLTENCGWVRVGRSFQGWLRRRSAARRSPSTPCW